MQLVDSEDMNWSFSAMDDEHLISAKYSINFSAKVTHSANSSVIFIW